MTAWEATVTYIDCESPIRIVSEDRAAPDSTALFRALHTGKGLEPVVGSRRSLRVANGALLRQTALIPWPIEVIDRSGRLVYPRSHDR